MKSTFTLNQRLLGAALFFFTAFSAQSGETIHNDGPTIVLHLHEQRLLDWPELARYSLVGPNVQARALPSNVGRARDKLLLRGTHAGVSDLLLFKADGSSEHRRIEVLDRPIAPLPKETSSILSRLEECEILGGGSQVILRGIVSKLEEARKIDAAIEQGHGAVKEEVELSPDLILRQKREVETWIAAHSLQTRFQVSNEAGRLLIRGSTRTPQLRDQAIHAIRLRAPLATLEISTLSDSSPTVYFQIFLLEIKKSRSQSLGLNWNTPVENAFRVTPTRIASNLGIDIALQALETDGALKVLSNPEIAVRAPGEAELFSGGELPIHLDTRFYSNVNWKSYGLSLKIKVIEANGETVRLDIVTEMSHLDRSTANKDVPGIQSNRMKTQVDASFGIPLLLSGLTTEQTREDAKGLPYLRRIPILGALFGSQDYLNDRSELVAMLVPRPVPPRAPHRAIERLTPKGPLPLIESQWSEREIERLREDPSYPWSLFQ